MTRRSKQAAVPVTPYTPTGHEVAAVKEQAQREAERRGSRLDPPKLQAVEGKPNALAPAHADEVVWRTAMEQVFGTTNPDATDLLFQAAEHAFALYPGVSPSHQLNGLLAILHGINPQDEIEGMLATQMVAVHLTAMGCFRRANLPDQTFEGRQLNLGGANKLVRSYAALVEALARHRGKGQQTVRVEHVTVQAGGQAIVGAVAHPGGGGAQQEKGRADA